MKVVLAGAFGKLGSDILVSLCNKGYEVVAADMVEKAVPGTEGKYTFVKIDATKPETLNGLCQGADVVITTMGLTGASTKVTNYDIDYQGNLNLLEEAKASKSGDGRGPHFVYISVIKADSDPNVPMIHAKALFEEKLKESGLTYLIFRPTGYFYDIAKVFWPMVTDGKVNLLGKKNYSCNVVDCPDFADFIVSHMMDKNKTYSVGGKETYTYEEIAKMFFQAAGNPPVIKRAPVFLFDLLAKAAKRKKNGKEAVIRFSKWTLTHDLVGDTIIPGKSFKEYIAGKSYLAIMNEQRLGESK